MPILSNTSTAVHTATTITTDRLLAKKAPPTQPATATTTRAGAGAGACAIDEEKLRQLYDLVEYDRPRRSYWDMVGLSDLVDPLIIPYLNNAKDVVMVHWMIGLTLLMLLSSTLIYITTTSPYITSTYPYLWIVMGLCHVVGAYFMFLASFMSLLHCTCHNRLINTKKVPWYIHGPINFYNSVFLSMFFGNSPETYYCHHIKMHHVEDNAFSDLSSTLPYQRDSVLHFLMYYGRFYFLGMIDLVRYFIRTNRIEYAVRAVCGEYSYHALGMFMLYTNWKLALFLYLIPFNITRIGMISGNWVQHAFIDHEDGPHDNVRSVITCVNTPYNVWGFNDGYHLNHHLHAWKHWTEHPQYFLDNVARYGAGPATVFRDLDYHQIFIVLMLHKYDYLASKVVHLTPMVDKATGEVIRDEAEIRKRTAQLLRDRCRIFTEDPSLKRKSKKTN